MRRVSARLARRARAHRLEVEREEEEVRVGARGGAAQGHGVEEARLVELRQRLAGLAGPEQAAARAARASMRRSWGESPCTCQEAALRGKLRQQPRASWRSSASRPSLFWLM